MRQYRVRLLVIFKIGMRKWEVAKREIALPVMPFRGLSLLLEGAASTDDVGFEFDLENLSYDLERDVFESFTGAHREDRALYRAHGFTTERRRGAPFAQFQRRASEHHETEIGGRQS